MLFVGYQYAMKILPTFGLFLAITGFSIALLSGCSGERKTPVEIGNEQQILHINAGAEPSGLDPHISMGLPESQIMKALFEGLTSKDPKTLNVVPGVAESWTISDDGLIYTLKLRTNARWSNGDELTAEDFAWSWQRALLPALGNQYAYSYFVIKNAEAFNKGQLADFSEVGIKALDKYTLQIELNHPTAYFLEQLAFKSMYPVHRATIEKFGTADERETRWTRPGNFVGNGAFTLTSWVPNQVLVVQKNTLYWDAQRIKLNEIDFYPIQQAATEERMYRAGQLHIVNVLPIEKEAAYRAANDPAFRSFPVFSTYYYRLNTTRPPLNDVRVRKALAAAIDRTQLTQKVLKGGQIPAYNFTPPNSAGYVPEAKLTEDVQFARKLLAEAGYPDGKGFPAITILYNTLEQHQTIAVVIQQMWKEALNIDVTIRNEDWKVFLASMRLHNYDIARAGWGGDYNDPNTFLDVHVTDGGNNETGWSNPRYDELIKLAAAAKNQTERFAYFQEAEALLVDGMPIIPLYTYVRNRLVNPSVKEWYDNILDEYYYKDVYLEASPKSSGTLSEQTDSSLAK